MSQESNTTNDTNPKPRLKIAGTPATPAAPASSGSEALPRFAFSRKKPAEEAPAVPVDTSSEAALGVTSPPLKRPPSTPRAPSATAGGEVAPEAAPSPIKHGNSATPFVQATPKPKASSRGGLGLRIVLLLLLLLAVGQAYYIFTMYQNEDQKVSLPPLLVKGGPNGPAYAVVNDGSDPPTLAYGFLLSFSPQVSAGDDPRLFFDGNHIELGGVIAAEYGLKWTRIDEKARELEFVDRQGRRYIKKF